MLKANTMLRVFNQDSSVKVSITEKGRKQALEIARKLKDRKFDIIFVSEFLRTQETVKVVIAGRDVEIKIDKRINEDHKGFEGENVENYRKARRASVEKINLF